MYFVILLTISPFLGLLKLFSFKNKHLSLIGSTLVMMLFGALFTYPSYSDGGEHLRRSIEYYTYMGFSEFISEFYFIITQQPNTSSQDLYIHILCFFTNSIFGLPQALHSVAGLILGIVIFQAIWMTLGKNLYKLTWRSGLVYLIVLLFVYSLHSLNAIRISTAMWVSYIGIVGFYKKRSLKYILIIILATQIHFAYYIIGPVGLVAVFVMRFRWLLIGAWFLSFSFSAMSGDLLKSYLPKSEVVEEKSKAYILNEERLDELGDDTAKLNWYKALGNVWFRSYALPILAVLLLPFFVNKKESTIKHLLISLFLTISIVSSFFTFLPSLQGRMMNLGGLALLFAAIIVSFETIHTVDERGFYVKLFKSFSWLFLFLSFPYVFENMSHVANTTEAFFIIGPILTVLISEPFSIKDFILYLI